MSAFIREHVPYNPYAQEIDNFEAVCRSLGEHGLVAADLLYVAVEGKPFVEGDEPSERMLIWGSTHSDTLTGYQEEANGKTSRHFDIFLWAVHNPERQVPAIVTYDINQLVPESKPPYLGQWWVHKNGGSVTEALRALVYLDPYRPDPSSNQ